MHGGVSPVRRFITESVCESQPPHLPRFRQDPRKVLGPRRPAKHTLWVIITGLITQHGAFAGGVGARSMPWVVAAGYHMAFQGGLEGGGGVVVLWLWCLRRILCFRFPLVSIMHHSYQAYIHHTCLRLDALFILVCAQLGSNGLHTLRCSGQC